MANNTTSKPKVVKLSDKSDYVIRDIEETFRDAAESEFKANELIVIMYSDAENCYEYHLGGNMDMKTLLWHAEQFKAAILDGRLG